MEQAVVSFFIHGFAYALCWIQAERGIGRLIPFNDNHRKAQA
jgi:hypothetical protein